MKIKKTLLSVAVIAALSLCSCSSSTDISGSYTADGLDNIYTFTSDGKIYVNDETESYSRYRVEGNKIVTYIDGSDEEMSLPFEKTDDGFMMGKLSYRKLPDFSELSDKDGDKEKESESREESGPYEEKNPEANNFGENNADGDLSDGAEDNDSGDLEDK